MADNLSTGSKSPVGEQNLGVNAFLTAPELTQVPSGQPNPRDVEDERKLLDKSNEKVEKDDKEKEKEKSSRKRAKANISLTDEQVLKLQKLLESDSAGSSSDVNKIGVSASTSVNNASGHTAAPDAGINFLNPLVLQGGAATAASPTFFDLETGLKLLGFVNPTSTLYPPPSC